MPRTFLTATINWARDLLISVAIAVVVILFIYQPVKVEGTSMMPALSDQERIFINKFRVQDRQRETSSAATWSVFLVSRAIRRSRTSNGSSARPAT